MAVVSKKNTYWPEIVVAPKPKVLDAFAGAGGFSLGFHLAGYHVIGAIEKDKWACDTFKFNHPNSHVIVSEIENLSDEDIKLEFKSNRPDIIIGGPPCQGYSICNKNAGDPKDPKNSLFREFLRLAAIFEPEIMIMENVPNLLKAKTEAGIPVIDIIKNEFIRMGYNVYVDILQAIDFGVPQIRRRLFVIASKKELSSPFPTPTHTAAEEISLFSTHLEKCPMLWDAISDLPEIDAGNGAEQMEYDSEPHNNFQNELRKEAKILFNHLAMRHTPRMIERFKTMEWGHSVSDVPQHLKPKKRNSQTISDKVYDQNNRRMHPFKPCHTIPASFYANFVHPYKHRNFTAREGARIQSFPDNYIFLGKPTVVSHKLLAREGRESELYLCQYNQIGNAVPPLLSKALAINLLKEIRC